MEPLRMGGIELRLEQVVGLIAVILTIILCTRSVQRTVRTSVTIANTDFQTATLSLQRNAEHETLIIDQIVSIQGRQAAVVDMETNNAARIKALEDRMASVDGRH